MYDVESIKNYILFLKTSVGLSITLHPAQNEKLIIASELMTFNIHDNPYCVYVKNFREAQNHCIERQKKVFDKCRQGSFCGSCFAGVREYVYPITSQSGPVGFICVSGYQSDNGSSYISATAQKYFIPEKTLGDVYGTLKREMPPQEEIDTLILPLCNMLELAYIKSADDGKNEEQLIDRVIRDIKRYHTSQITLDDVCRRLSCSRSQISHIFKKQTGKSFKQYLNEVRLEDAKTLLRYSKLSLTEIALSVGFSDSAYFSSVFTKYTGHSPAAYRRSFKK